MDRIRILIVEDSQSDLELLQRELKKSGFNFTSENAQTREEFEDALDIFKPDIILSDYSLPSFDGVTAFHIKQKKYPFTPFIIVSGTIGEENAVELIKKGVSDYAIKDKLYSLAPKITRALKEADEIKAKRIADEKLKKLTDQSPGVIYQLEMSKEGVMKFDFISEGISNLHPTLNVDSVKTNPEIAFKVIHPEDIQKVMNSIQYSFLNLTEWQIEYRVIQPNGQIHWNMGLGIPEKLDNGSVVWYGTFQNITSRIEYESTMEQIAFDISHVLRRPVATLLGLSSMIIEDKKLNAEKLKEYSNYINIVSTELDNYTRKLNETYNLKSQMITGNNSSQYKSNISMPDCY